MNIHEQDENYELNLNCIFCEGRAEIIGKWANAKVTCRECGMESSIKLYNEQIEKWQEDICLEIYHEKNKILITARQSGLKQI